MGDVGKFCIVQGLKAPGVKIRPVALSAPSEGSDAEISVDVTYQEGKDRVAETFGSLSTLPRVNIMSEGAQAEIEAELMGCDSVIACLGSRQPSKKERWLALGATKVVGAMKSAGVTRLVNLSSMGIGDDGLPISGWKIFWAVFLRLVIPSAHADLIAMEKTVAASGLDYLLVRAMGLTPEERPRGRWDLVEKRGDGNLSISSSKEDVASFMLKEAVTPEHHNAAITIGYKE